MTLRHNCDTGGCYFEECCPKYDVFAECFPGKINFTDVDGIVEIHGHFLLLEWKRSRGSCGIPTGQRLMFESMTLHREFQVVVAVGNPKTMEVSEVCVWRGGKSLGWEASSLEGLKARFKWWADRAKRMPRRRSAA